MMGQRRQEAKDRLRSLNDYQVNLKAELEIRHLHEKIDHLLGKQWQRLAEIQQLSSRSCRTGDASRGLAPPAELLPRAAVVPGARPPAGARLQQAQQPDAGDEAADVRRPGDASDRRKRIEELARARMTCRTTRCRRTSRRDRENSGTIRIGTSPAPRHKATQRVSADDAGDAPDAPSMGCGEPALNTACANWLRARAHVERDEPHGPQPVFERGTEDPQRPHIQDDVQPPAMHQHGRDEGGRVGGGSPTSQAHRGQSSAAEQRVVVDEPAPRNGSRRAGRETPPR